MEAQRGPFRRGLWVCYLLQYGLVVWLNARLPIDHYYNHLIGMVFYTVLNFVLNKFYTFKA